MKGLYQKVKNYMIKPVVYTGLAALTFVGCEKKTEETSYKSQPVKQKSAIERTYFDDWGFIDELDLKWGNYGILDDLEISLGDMDNDGDLDIIVGSRITGLRIYENMIPQKSEESKKE